MRFRGFVFCLPLGIDASICVASTVRGLQCSENPIVNIAANTEKGYANGADG